MIGWVAPSVALRARGAGHSRLHHDPTCGYAADLLVPVNVTGGKIWPRRSHQALALPWCQNCFEQESPGPWAEHGACLGSDPDVFFPTVGASTKEARAICASCRVFDDCRAYAFRVKPPCGVWGGVECGVAPP